MRIQSLAILLILAFTNSHAQGVAPPPLPAADQFERVGELTMSNGAMKRTFFIAPASVLRVSSEKLRGWTRTDDRLVENGYNSVVFAYVEVDCKSRKFTELWQRLPVFGRPGPAKEGWLTDVDLTSPQQDSGGAREIAKHCKSTASRNQGTAHPQA